MLCRTEGVFIETMAERDSEVGPFERDSRRNGEAKVEIAMPSSGESSGSRGQTSCGYSATIATATSTKWPVIH